MSAVKLESLDRDQLLQLARRGLAFTHKRRGFGELARCVQAVVQRVGQLCTFEILLSELELEAVRRDRHGERASPVEKVDRIFELLTWYHTKNGRTQSTFGTLRNHLTKAKKISCKDNSRNPVNRESGLKQCAQSRPGRLEKD